MQVNILNATAAQLRNLGPKFVNKGASTAEARIELMVQGYQFIVYDERGKPHLTGTSIQKALTLVFGGAVKTMEDHSNFVFRIKTAPSTLADTKKLLKEMCLLSGFKSQGPKLFPMVDAGGQVFFIEKQLAGGCFQLLEIRLAGTAAKPTLEVNGGVYDNWKHEILER